MTETNVIILAAVIGALVGGGIAYFISNSQIKKAHQNAIELLRQQEFFRAASKFKATIIYELSGFYPINQHWEKHNFPNIYQSIPIINSAATEFRYFVSSKTDFDKTVDDYNKYCRETKADKVFALDFPSTKGKSPKDYMEEFKNIVEHLFSFANKDFKRHNC